MSPELTYLKFLQKVNKGNTGENIACDRGQFVLIVNESKNRWVEEQLNNKDSILIDSLQEIVKDVEFLAKDAKIYTDYVEFPLDSDFYEGILVKAECQKEDCKSVIYSREVKNQNKNILQFDENQKPDFDYEWTFHSIQGNKLRLYKSDFSVLKTTLEYYSVIPDFDISGYTNYLNKPSTDKPFILSDQYVDQILNRAAEEFMRDYENQIGLTIAKERKDSEE